MTNKKRFQSVFILCILFTSLSNAVLGQKIDTISRVDKRKMDSLSNIILEAHRTFKKLSDDVSKHAQTSVKKTFATKTDSIFKARRGVVNALLNNLYLLPDNQKQLALTNLESYLTGASNANKILFENNSKKAKAVASFAGTMKESNKTVLTDLNFVSSNAGTNISFGIRPNNFLKMDVSFPDHVKRSDYVFYLFPIIWCGDSDKLGPCYDNNKWGDLKNCGRIGLAKEWSDGRAKKLSGLYSGSYTLLLYRKSLNMVVHKDEVILPLDSTYTYTIPSN